MNCIKVDMKKDIILTIKKDSLIKILMANTDLNKYMQAKRYPPQEHPLHWVRKTQTKIYQEKFLKEKKT